ncbi:MAG: DUF2569 family protein [Syntrophorhabdus sp.]
MNGQQSELRGVKGWLLLLCINLSILDPFANLLNLAIGTHLGRQYFDQNPALQRLMVINGVCSIALAVFSIYAGISLWRVLPNAVTTAKKYLGAAFAYSIVSLFLPYLVGLSEEVQKEVGATSLLNSFVTALYLYVWYQYLKRSKRVNATYSAAQPAR